MVLETPITSRAGFARLSSGGSANSSIRRRSLIPQSRVAGRVEVKSGEILCFLVKQFVYKTVPVLSTISSIQAKLYDQTYRVDCYSQSKPL